MSDSRKDDGVGGIPCQQRPKFQGLFPCPSKAVAALSPCFYGDGEAGPGGWNDECILAPGVDGMGG